MKRIAVPIAAILMALLGIWIGSYATLKLDLDDWRAVPGILTAVLLTGFAIGMLVHCALVAGAEDSFVKDAQPKTGG
jgi:uncharacterized membrane protein YczE